MIIDSHLHAYPHLSGANGWPSVNSHLNRMQRDMYFSTNPPRYKRDNAPVPHQTLWNEKDIGPEGLREVGFRPGRFGRLEWTADGQDIYLQFLAPSQVDPLSPPEYMLVEMDYAGVDVGVLQQGGLYGRFNDFYAEVMQKHAGRYIGLAQIEEATAHTDMQLAELRRCALQLGLKGLFYEVLGFWESGYADTLDAKKYAPFWAEVERLGLVVYWDPAGGPRSTAEEYTDQLARIVRVLERHPSIRSVLVQAFPLSYYAPRGRYEFPSIVDALDGLDDFLFEVAYPISYGGKYDYPYRETWPCLHQLYDRFGPRRLVWGSDMPNVLRFCTYRQSRRFLHYCEFVSKEDLALIEGQNLARVFQL